MFKSGFLILFLCFVNLLIGQEQNYYRTKIDSLLLVLPQNSNTLDSTLTYIEIARNYDKLQQDSTLFYASKALVLSDQLQNQALRYESLLRIANYHFLRYDWEKTLPALEVLEASCLQLEVSDCMAVVNYSKGAVFYSQADFKQAEEFFKKALENYKDQKNYDRITSLLRVLSTVLEKNGKYDESLEALVESKKILEENNPENYAGFCSTYSMLGNLYRYTLDFDKALLAFKQALVFAYKSDAVKAIIETTLSIAEIYIDQEDYQPAISYLKEAQKATLKTDSEYLDSRVNEALGNYYFKTKNYEQSLYHNTKAYDNFFKKSRLNDVFVGNRILVNMANLRIKKKQYTKAELLAQELLEDAEKKGELSTLAQAHNLFYRIAYDQGNYEKAIVHLSNHSNLKDSISTLTLQNKVKEFQTKYEVLEKDIEIEQLLIKEQENVLKTSKTKNFIYGLGFLASIFLSLGAFFYMRYKRKSRTLTIVKQQRRAINKSLKEKELLLKEIHHRVKNNLQLINSILGIQASSLDESDEKINLFLEKSEARIYSMSLIHQILYESDDLDQINFKVYLEKLIHFIQASYGETNIQYQLKLDAIHFDLQTSLALGLISHEVILNAIKHAFTNEPNKEIKVELSHSGKAIEFAVSDNGIGYSTNKKTAASFGMELVGLLAEQLEATLTLGGSVGHRFALTFPTP